MLAFLYKKNWFFIIAGAEINVDLVDYQPEVSQIPRMLAHVSKAIQGIPILEGCSLTRDDAVMVDYSMQPAREDNRGGRKATSRKLKNVGKRQECLITKTIRTSKEALRGEDW